MARKKELLKFSRNHKLKIGTIDDLIKYKIANEKTIERIHECEVSTDYGDFNSIYYKDVLTNQVHFVMIKNKIGVMQGRLLPKYQNRLCLILLFLGNL